MTFCFIGSVYLEYFSNSRFPYLTINVVATNIAGSSVYVFDRVLADRWNVHTRVKIIMMRTKCKTIFVYNFFHVKKIVGTLAPQRKKLHENL